MNATELLDYGRRTSQNLDGIYALQQFLSSNPDDSRANAARLRLARRLLGARNLPEAETVLSVVCSTGSEDEKAAAKYLEAYIPLYAGNYLEAAEDFESLANNGQVPQGIRQDSRRRAAASYHVAQNYPRAWKNFTLLEQQTTDPGIVAEARLEKAGLALELAGRGKGELDEVVALCEGVIDTPGCPRNIEATANLMILETTFYDGDFDLALTRADAFIKEYADIRREWISASVWKGIIEAKLGNFDQAVESLVSVMEQAVSRNEKFGNHEPQAKAGYWLAWLELQRGNQTAAKDWVTTLEPRFPDRSETSEAKNLVTSTRTVDDSIQQD